MAHQLILHHRRVRAADNLMVSWSKEGGDADLTPFAIPLTSEDQEQLRWYLEDYLRYPYAHYADVGQSVADSLPVLGQALFSAAFPPESKARELFEQATAIGLEQVDLIISSDSAEFLGLPWELIQPSDSTPLAFRLAGLVRQIPHEGAPAHPIELGGDVLRVLMVIARPRARADVPYQMVAQPLLERIGAVDGTIELTVLRPPTLESLRHSLHTAHNEGRRFHVVHFDGHGGFEARLLRYAGGSDDQATGPRGVLLFERDDGAPHLVSGSELAGLLQQEGVPVFVLNACRSAMVEGGHRADASVAAQLLQAGAAVVVAMGYSIYAVAAAEFTAEFYRALHCGKSVAGSVRAGRNNLLRMRDRPTPKGPMPLFDWLVPVLYRRCDVQLSRVERVVQPRPLNAEDRLGGDERQRNVECQHGSDSLIVVEGTGFVGRHDEFYSLEKAVLRGSPLVLFGEAGSGKTALVKAFARWMQQTKGLAEGAPPIFYSFDSGVSSFELDVVVAAMGRSVFGPTFARLSESRRRRKLVQFLVEHRALVIWDNFETVCSMPDPVDGPLSDNERTELVTFLEDIAKGGTTIVLITSRSREVWLGSLVSRMHIGALSREDAVELSDRLLMGRPAVAAARCDERFVELLDRLRGNPLAMRILLPHVERGIGALLEVLEGTPGLTTIEKEREVLATSVEYSYRHLKPAVQRILPAVALFRGVTHPGLLEIFSNERAAPKRFQGVKTPEWGAALRDAEGFGLLTSSTSSYMIHPALPAHLLHRWSNDSGQRFEAELGTARRAWTLTMVALASVISTEVHTARASQALRQSELHRWNLERAFEWLLEDGRWNEASTMLGALHRWWESAGLFAEAAAWYNRVIRAVEGSRSVPRLTTARGKLWLLAVSVQARRAKDMGDLSAAEREYRRLEEALTESSGAPDTIYLSHVCRQLGRVAQDRGQFDVAEDWLRKAMEWTTRK